MMKRLGKIIYNICFVILVVIAALILLTSLDIPGNIKLFSVQSGSREPAIHMGSITIVKPMDSYQVGDIITVAETTDNTITVTHRITAINEQDGNTTYTTKGDANDATDPEARPAVNVLGKVIFSVPLLGYLVTFSKTRDGLLLLIIIPSVIIIFTELINIRDEAKRILAKKKKGKLSVSREIGDNEFETKE